MWPVCPACQAALGTGAADESITRPSIDSRKMHTCFPQKGREWAHCGKINEKRPHFCHYRSRRERRVRATTPPVEGGGGSSGGESHLWKDNIFTGRRFEAL